MVQVDLGKLETNSLSKTVQFVRLKSSPMTFGIKTRFIKVLVKITNRTNAQDIPLEIRGSAKKSSSLRDVMLAMDVWVSKLEKSMPQGD